MPQHPIVSSDILHRRGETGAAGVVFVIDDDSSMRSALGSLFRSVGFEVELFSSAQEWQVRKLPNVASCLVLDIRLPGASGLEFQSRLATAGVRIPVVFITGYGDIPMTVRAMKAGAVDFLTKPFRDQDMLDAVTTAIERDLETRRSEQALQDLEAAYRTLTAREREVMTLVTSGLMNKQVAARLGVSEITVKVHRGRVMQKMKANSLADLVRAAEALSGAGLAVDDGMREATAGSMPPMNRDRLS